MNIAVDIRSLTDERMTGVGFYTRHLVEALAEAAPQHQFFLLASGSRGVLARLPQFRAANIHVTKVNLPNRLLFFLMKLPGGPTLESFLPRKPDVWIFPKGNIFKTRLPYLLTVHDLAFVLFPQFITFKERLHHRFANTLAIAERAQGILAVSESTAHDLKICWQIAPEKITVTPLGVDHAHFVPREQPSDRAYRATYDLNRPYILALATQEPRKNFESIIQGYDSYRAQGGKAIPLVLSGSDGWKNHSVRELIANSPYQSDILVLGYVPDKHKAAIYRGASCFVFPSFYEGFGLPALEAMACGVPVITSVTSSLPEVVGKAGILIDPFNVNDVTSALKQLLDAPDSDSLRRRLSRDGLLQAAQFSWHKTALATLKALSKLTAF